MNKFFLTLAFVVGCAVMGNAQTAAPSNNVNTYKDGQGNQWVTLTPVTFSSAKKPKVHVSYDDYNAINDPNGIYKGKENNAYDGVRQNKSRNLRYMNSSAKLPPNSGKIY